jgi:competence protein ComGC
MAGNHFKLNRGFTIWELLCIVLIILFLAAIMMPSLNKVKKISSRVVCGTNLKGLGTAASVYANDYDDWFPELPGEGEWSKKLGFAYDMEKPDFGKDGAQRLTGRTISASWYLLVREADVSPKSFVCHESNQTAFGYEYYSSSENFTTYWDFGDDPYKHVSYSMHNPYGRFPTKGASSASFGFAGDMSPWFDHGDIVPPNINNREWWKAVTLLPPYFSDSSISREKIMQANSIPHHREGQNVTFADGHSEYVKISDVGVKHDNIYTFWSGVSDSIGLGEAVENGPKPEVSESDKRIGTNPTSRSKENDAKSAEDSFLAI